jgi:O-antigen/teichoic acid export membrane protein
MANPSSASLDVIHPRDQALTMPRSLSANFAWTLTGTVLYAACQWGMLIVLARLGSPEAVGQFAFGLAVSSPLIIFSQLALRSVQATDAKNTFRFEDFLALRLVTTLFAVMGVVVIALFSAHTRQAVLVIVAVGCAKAFESMSDVYYGLLQQHERMDRIARSLIIKGPLMLIALGIIVYATHDVFLGTLGMAFVSALTLVLYDVPSRALLYSAGSSAKTLSLQVPMPQRRALMRLAWLSLPLGAATWLISLTTNVPRYFVQHHLGDAQLGIFATVAYFPAIGLMISGAHGQAITPRLAQYYATGRRLAYLKLLLTYAGQATVLGLGGIALAALAGRPILTKFYGAQYAQYGDLFTAVMIGAAIQYLASVFGYAMTAVHYFRLQPFILIVAAASTLVLSAVLVPRQHLMGAAIAWSAGSLIQALGMLASTLRALSKMKARA